jgi:hypothetical protein
MEKNIVGLCLYSFAWRKGGIQQIALIPITMQNIIPQIIVSISILPLFL